MKRNMQWSTVLPMAFHVAWLWSFPLMGPLQPALLSPASAFTWNLVFLTGLIFGFFSHLLPWRSSFHKAKTGFLVMSMALLMLLSSLFPFLISVPSNLLPFQLIMPLLLGMLSGIFMVRWAVQLAGLPDGQVGLQMGGMMLVACLFYSLVILLHSHWTGIVLGFLFLVCSAEFPLPDGVPQYSKPGQQNAGAVERQYAGRGCYRYWIPFLVILFAFYLFSGNLLYHLLPLSRENSLFLSVFGSILYGVTALAAGLYWDRFRRMDNIALVSLVFLGIFYLMMPVAEPLGMIPLVNLGVEMSYALVDVFIWISIATAARVFHQRPEKCFGFGLGMNIVFLMTGLVADRGFAFFSDVNPDFTTWAILAGVMMLVGVFPAVSMKKLNGPKKQGSSHTSHLAPFIPTVTLPEDFTPRETEVFQALMTELDNEAIQQELSISKNTLKTHIRHIYSKSEVKSRYELIVKYHGLEDSIGDIINSP